MCQIAILITIHIKKDALDSELAPFLWGLSEKWKKNLRLSHLYRTSSCQNAKMCFLLAPPLDHTEKLSGFFFPGGVSLNHAQEWFTGRHRKPESFRGGGGMARILSGKRLSSRFFSTKKIMEGTIGSCPQCMILIKKFMKRTIAVALRSSH